MPRMISEMTCRSKLFVSATMLGLASLFSYQAHAGLIGVGNTVQVIFVNGTALPLGLIPAGGSTSDPTSLAAPVNYPDQSSDGFAVAIADTQIVVTNLVSDVPFCFSNTVGTAC